jgi:hypothetical protein
MRSRHNESKDDLLQRREFNTAASEDAICGTGASVVARSRSEQQDEGVITSTVSLTW